MYREEEIINCIKSYHLNPNFKGDIFYFMKNYPLSNRKIDIFLKLKKQNEQIGFYYRCLLTACYEYNVPLVYINEYKLKLKILKLYKPKKEIIRIKELQHKSHLLFCAVKELMIKNNSRKEKILKLMEKISDNKN